MFRRIIIEEWHTAVAMLSFAIFFVVFVASAIRACLMSRPHLQRLESLPLQNETLRPSHD